MKTIALCTDIDGGLSFYHKRQSKDREIRKKLFSYSKEIVSNEYGASQFKEEDGGSVIVLENPLNAKDGIIFLEADAIPNVIPDDIQRILIFRFDLKYPSDRKLNFDLRGWTLKKTEKIKGYSHDEIMLEEYAR